MRKLVSASALLLLMNANANANADIRCELAGAASCSDLDPISQLKVRVKHAMEPVTGWCTADKWNMLIDLIYMKNNLADRPLNIVEIGVWGGKSLLPMAFALKEIGRGKISGIDPWTADASKQGQTGDNLEWWGKAPHEKVFQDLNAHINQHGLAAHVDLIRNTSADASAIPNIDILHIDGNHSAEVSLADVKKWVPHVKSGGVIAFDDITWILGHKVADNAVAYLNQHCIQFNIYKQYGPNGELSNVWGIWIKP